MNFKTKNRYRSGTIKIYRNLRSRKKKNVVFKVYSRKLTFKKKLQIRYNLADISIFLDKKGIKI